MNRKLILSSIIGGSIGATVLSAGFLLISKTKSEKLVCYLLFATFLTLYISSIAFLKLGNSLLDVSKKGDTAKVKSLLKIGVNIDAKNSLEQTPLHFAVLNNDIETVKLLLEHKANVNAKDLGHYDSLLYIAVNKGYVEIAKLLLEHGANVNFSCDRDTLLHLAAANGQVEMVKLLVEN